MDTNAKELFNIIIYTAAVTFIAVVMLLISYVLGQRHTDRTTEEPYESGIKSTGDARIRFSGKYYIIAMFFVIFDLETVFFVAWAVSFREAGWYGFAGILVFSIFLFSILIYEWRIGAFKFSISGKDILKALKKQNN